MKTILNIAIMLLSMLLLGIVLNSCKSSSTEMAGTRHNPVIKKDYHSVLVATLTSNKSVVDEDLGVNLASKQKRKL